jgi:hypothetical protein
MGSDTGQGRTDITQTICEITQAVAAVGVICRAAGPKEFGACAGQQGDATLHASACNAVGSGIRVFLHLFILRSVQPPAITGGLYFLEYTHPRSLSLIIDLFGSDSGVRPLNMRVGAMVSW